MNGKPWTDEEYGLVQSSDLTNRELAAILGRTEKAVKVTRGRLRRGWKPFDGYWTELEDAVILDTLGLPIEEVSRRLGRSWHAVNGRRQTLRRHGVTPKIGPNASPFKIGHRRAIALTCTECGLLLGAEWFERAKKRWRRICHRCRPQPYSRTQPARNRAKAYLEACQAATSAIATNHRKEWTDADIQVVADPELTALEKAVKLRRTYYSVQSALHNGGFRSKHSGFGDPKNAQWLIDNPNAARIDEITASLKQEFETAGVPFPTWDWDDEDLKETAA